MSEDQYFVGIVVLVATSRSQYTCLYRCLPSAEIFGDKILVSIGENENYSAQDIQKIIARVGQNASDTIGRVYEQVGFQIVLSTTYIRRFLYFLRSIHVGSCLNSEQVKNITLPSISPGVPVTCVYGTGVPTPVQYTFARGLNGESPSIRYGSGDGQQDDTTNTVCAHWVTKDAKNNRRAARVQAFPNATHDGILSDARFHSYLVDTVLRPLGGD